jgi:transcription initiation factor IIE alpha subunit
MLNRTSGLPEIVGLSTKEKAVLLYLTSFGVSTAGEISKKLRIKQKNLYKILSSLVENDLVKEANSEYTSLLNINFEEIVKNPLEDDTVAYKHPGELVPFKIDEKTTTKVLDLFNPDEVERKQLYYPYWLIFYDDGKVDVVDALTGDKDDYLSEGSFEELAI